MSQIPEAAKKVGKLGEQVGRVVYWSIRLAGVLIILAGLGLWLFTGIDIIWPLAVSGVGVLALFPFVPLIAFALLGHLVLIATGLVLVYFGLGGSTTEGHSLVMIVMGLVFAIIALHDLTRDRPQLGLEW